MLQVRDIHHVSLIVESTSRSLAFYCDLLGLSQDHSRTDLGYPGAWVYLGNKQLHLLELPNPDPVNGRPEHGGRDRHVAMSVNDIQQLADLLSQQNLPYSLSKSGRKALFCRDPDGNALEFIETPPT